VAERLGSGLQSRTHGFESRHSLRERRALDDGVNRPGKSAFDTLINALRIFRAFAILLICRFGRRTPTGGLANAKKKKRESNALTSLAGQTWHPHHGWRCPGW
jgi:hypothetical protein